MIAVMGWGAYGHRDPPPAHQTDVHHAPIVDDGHVSGGRDDVGHCAEWADDHQDLGHGIYPFFSHSIIIQ